MRVYLPGATTARTVGQMVLNTDFAPTFIDFAGRTPGHVVDGRSLVSLLQARDKGLPVKIIAAGSSSTATSGADVTMIHAGPNSGIKSAKDVKIIRPTVDQIVKGIPEVIKQWRETFGV